MSTVRETLTIETYRRFHAAVNSGDLAVIETAIEEFFHPDARFHTAEPSGLTAIAVQKQIWATLLRAFPDLHVTVDDLLCADDKIVARQTVTGTNTGEYRGMPPTGRTVRYSEIFIFRFADGQIVDLWGVVDVLSQLRQLGHVT